MIILTDTRAVMNLIAVQSASTQAKFAKFFELCCLDEKICRKRGDIFKDAKYWLSFEDYENTPLYSVVAVDSTSYLPMDD
eukprot:IDg11798t1